MKTKMFSVYDCKAEAYLPPFFMRSTGEALRGFIEIVNDASHAFSRHPGDYTLFELGEFEDTTGQFELFNVKKNLGTALEHKRKPAELVPAHGLHFDNQSSSAEGKAI